MLRQVVSNERETQSPMSLWGMSPGKDCSKDPGMACSVAGAATCAQHARKYRKYCGGGQVTRGSFTPLSMETYTRHGKPAMPFLSTLAASTPSSAPAASDFTSSSFMAGVIIISFLIHRVLRRLSRPAMHFLRSLANAAASSATAVSDVTTSSFVTGGLREISAALVKGNKVMYQEALHTAGSTAERTGATVDPE
jgi:hypothetical protein